MNQTRNIKNQPLLPQILDPNAVKEYTTQARFKAIEWTGTNFLAFHDLLEADENVITFYLKVDIRSALNYSRPDDPQMEYRQELVIHLHSNPNNPIILSLNDFLVLSFKLLKEEKKEVRWDYQHMTDVQFHFNFIPFHTNEY